MRAEEHAGLPAEAPPHGADSHEQLADEAVSETSGATEPDEPDEPDESDEHEKPNGGPNGHRPSGPSLYETRTRRSTRSSLARDRTVSATGTDPGLARTVSRSQTILSHIRSRPVPTFTHPLTRVQTTKDVLVDFDGPDDLYRPLNWPTHKKVLTTLLYGLTTMTATWASSSYSAGTPQVALAFDVSEEVATLGTTLFLLGFGVGPLLWAPLSEVYGRRIAVLTPMFVAVCFSFGSATAKDFQTLMLTRFFGAFFASAPVTNTGGVLGDLYTPAWRGIAMAGYAMAVVGGPVLGKPSGPVNQVSPQLLNLTPLCRSHRVRRCRHTALSRLALDRIPDRHSTSFHSCIRLDLRRRKLCARAARIQGAAIAPRKRKLGAARSLRGMGR